MQREGQPIVFCGDLNVAHREIDVHPKERKDTVIGQLPEERALFDRLLAAGLVDVGRTLDPDNDRAASRGGRPGATCASATSGGGSTTCWRARPWRRTAVACAAYREVGTSDHAPVVAEM